MREANIEKPSKVELAAAQGDMLEELLLLENGVGGGCSPYGCPGSQADDGQQTVLLPMPSFQGVDL